MKINTKAVICLFLTAFFTSSRLFCQVRPIVQNLNVYPHSNTQIKLEWDLPQLSEPEIKSLVIIRDTRLISSYEQITDSNIIAKLDASATEYLDTVKDKKDYFYCILAYISDTKIYKIILPSINTTVNGIKARTFTQEGVVISKEPAQENLPKIFDPSEKLRKTPLPRPDLTDSSSKNKIQLGPAALEAGRELGLQTLASQAFSKEYVFEQDLISPQGGDDYFLFKILKESFVRKNYENSIKSLIEFLSVHRDQNTQNRSYFYLGESYYFSKDYQNALYCFLKVQQNYPELSKKWIDSCLDLIQLPDHS